MFKTFILAGLMLACNCLLANDYDKAWEALHKNDRKATYSYLQKALKDPTTASDAYLTLIFLNTFEGKEKSSTEFIDKVMRSKDADAYLYALWFNAAALGPYGKKHAKTQIDLLEYIFNNSKNGSIKAAAHYVKASHYLYSNQWDNAVEEWKKVQSFLKWQFVGPFENLSGSGFYKDHGPLANPEKTAVFSGINNAPLQWFTPAFSNQDAWKFVNSHILNSTAVTYAQTFVYSPIDQQVILNVGGNGSLKVWVNDALILTESKEQVTELDYYRAPCKLNKGYNRILVQLGYTRNSSANFIVRCTDENGNAIAGLTDTDLPQSYTKLTTDAQPLKIEHFAEAFFKARLKTQPHNPINYILLTQTLLRNQRTFEARKTIESVLKKFPDNSLLRFELIKCFLKDNNRTLLSQEVERLREKDPNCYITYKLNIDRLMDEEKYEEADALYDEMVKAYDEDDDELQLKIRILNARKKYDDAIKLIQDSYVKYPQNFSFVEMMFNVHKYSNKDIDKALAVYEKYLEDNFNYKVVKQIGQEYVELGKKEKGLQYWNRLLRMFPYDTDLLTDMVRHYFQQQDYKTAGKYCDSVLSIAPFVANYWENKGIVAEQDGRTKDASESYEKALLYDSKKYDTRKRLRTLAGKKDLYKQFPETDVYDLIKKSATKEVSKEYGYYYLLDEKQTIVYAEGGSEEYVTLVVRINTPEGIDDWKESYVPFNRYSQTLLIEKAEVVKKNGSKLQAEKDDNEFVFTSLEAGDAIILKYRIQNYSSGRLAAEFWDRYVMTAFVPADITRYVLLIDKKVQFKYELTNSDLKPQIQDVDEFKMYTWEIKDIKPVESEPYMPSLTDVGPALHLSTIKSWDNLVEWYSDISHFHIEDEYELKEVYDSIFADAKNLKPLDKARRIYTYIQENIRYSHTPFRQGAYIPQKPSVTLNTRLGDCKDLSSLFVSLASMAGLKSSMVLVDTRDNGLKEMTLPSVEFNHCIVLLEAEGKQYYLELTDNDLPFGSLPYNLPGAMSLVIPDRNGAALKGKLEPIKPSLRTKDLVKRVSAVEFDGTNMKVKVQMTKTGALTSALRSTYRNLTEEKQRQKLQEGIAGAFKNPVNVSDVKFSGLDLPGDSIGYAYSLLVKNEVIEVGDMNMIKVPYGDIIATLDNFSKDNRDFPVEYWRYEDADAYQTEMTITLPAGKKLLEVPKSESFTFGKNTYSLKFTPVGDNKLKITRTANLHREDIGVAEYAAFQEFLNKIVKAESKYVAFK